MTRKGKRGISVLQNTAFAYERSCTPWGGEKKAYVDVRHIYTESCVVSLSNQTRVRQEYVCGNSIFVPGETDCTERA